MAFDDHISKIASTRAISTLFFHCLFKYRNLFVKRGVLRDFFGWNGRESERRNGNGARHLEIPSITAHAVLL